MRTFITPDTCVIIYRKIASQYYGSWNYDCFHLNDNTVQQKYTFSSVSASKYDFLRHFDEKPNFPEFQPILC